MSRGILLPRNHFFLNSANEMDAILEPLKRVGIQYFTFMRNYKNGQQIYLSSIPGWVEDYYQIGLYRQFISKSPEDYQSGLVIWPKDTHLAVFELAKQRYNSDHGVTLIKSRDKYTDYYFFSTTTENTSIINLYLNHSYIFEQFVAYFEDRAEPLISKAESCRVELPQLLSQNFSNRDFNIHLDCSDIIKSIKDMRIRKYRLKSTIYNGVKLSAQEVDCVINYLEFNTAEETAKNMGVSKRTVESYFVNIKNKLGCDSKEEVVHRLILDGFDFLKVFYKKPAI